MFKTFLDCNFLTTLLVLIQARTHITEVTKNALGGVLFLLGKKVHTQETILQLRVTYIQRRRCKFLQRQG
jgi:hypothetical protein